MVVIVAVATQSAQTLIALADSADARDLATSIESGIPIDPQYLMRFSAERRGQAWSTKCLDAATRADVTVGLAAIDAAVAFGDNTKRRDNEVTTLQVLKRRLSCNPLDGNAWLQLSKLETRLHAPSNDDVQALRMSYRTAPNEGWVIEPRLLFGSLLYLSGARDIEAGFLADLQRFTQFGTTDQIAAAYVAAEPRIRDLLRPSIAAQEAKRRNAILAEIDRLGVLFDAR